MNVRIEHTKQPKNIPTPEELGHIHFGTVFTDHMLMIDYDKGKGWHDARIIPYGPLSLDPATSCLHYGQLIFEGMKAYKHKDGRIVMFRPDMNMKRMNDSCDRMCIAPIDEKDTLEAISELVKTDSAWIPGAPGTSLYVRPFIFASEAFLGVHPSKSFTFATILSPVGAYFKEGLAPVRIYVEDKYVRAVRGGTGYSKCAGNYAGSLKSQEEAEAAGYSQVLWLDGVERKYIEEVGGMNIFFVIDGEVITPELNGSILPGITRDSIIEVTKSWGMPMKERTISIQELSEAHKAGKAREAFCAGTAAVVSPIGELKWKDAVMRFNDGKIGDITQRLYDEITGIQTGAVPDRFGWLHTVK
ncbi:MAG: branched-chain amino acid aminotransferase [Synergistaceae bacterium]|jgi:branched-chain amino acid aminotransferase|nr:branched-chain amino acid aminotransferase [Synergistaceae bacterium]